jgi:hypothetical protein
LANPIPLPVSDPITQPPDPKVKNDPNGWACGQTWQKYFQSQGQSIASSPSRVTDVPLTAQSTSIGATALNASNLNAGLYRISWFAHITTAATVSSSLTVGLGCTDHGVPLSFTFPALTGNTTSTAGTGTATLQSDANAPVTYTITYASSGATPMQYTFRVLVELMP